MNALNKIKYFPIIIVAIITVFFSCKKEEPVIIPDINTELTVTNITGTTATSGGNITSDNGETVTARGVCWSTGITPTIKDSLTKDVSGAGSYISQLKNLSPNTSYYLRAYAINRFGTFYGSAVYFKTLVDSLKLITSEIINITSTTATGGGNITSDGSGIISERGICWSTAPNPTVQNSKTSDGTGKGNYVSMMTNLTRATTYYVRAYAKNERAVSYGNTVTFTTVIEKPTVSTTLPTNIGNTSVRIGGNVTDNGGVELLERGVCYSTSPNPTINGGHTSSGTTVGAFATVLTGLAPQTTYYVRAFATNITGTSYGSQESFTTTEKPQIPLTITDVEGNVYNTITIGTQTWLIENLRTTKYNDGTSIPIVADSYSWPDMTSAAYCWYNNDISNKSTNGALYNWYAVNSGKLAPVGWHIPTDAELTTLENYLIANGYNYDGSTSGNKIAKSLASKNGWSATSTTDGAVGNDFTKNNTSNFSMLPSGYRGWSSIFDLQGMSGYLWTSSESSNGKAWLRAIGYSTVSLNRLELAQYYGFSVRCIMN
jgi:uncharacterized protein (TIGR02145 family)